MGCPLLVICPIPFGSFDIFLLCTLVSSTKEDDQLGSVLSKIDAVIGTEIDSWRRDAFAHRFRVSRIPKLQAV
jgi:hypothetical protein